MNSEKKEFYVVRMACSNCGHRASKQFEHGKRCDGKHECPNCKCHFYERTLDNLVRYSSDDKSIFERVFGKWP